MDLYCVKCRARTDTTDQTTITTKNNRLALTGKCVTCGTKKFRFLKKSNSEVILPQNLQNSPEPHGQNTPEKSTFQNIATVVPEQD